MTLNPMVVNAVISSREFDLPCQGANENLPQCQNPAAWGLWLSHTRGGCDVVVNMCDVHKRLMDRLWPLMMRGWPESGTCPQCGKDATNKLEENLRWLPL